MNEEQIQVANVSPVMHEDVIDISIVMEPVVGQVSLIDGTRCENANSAPCVVAKQL